MSDFVIVMTTYPEADVEGADRLARTLVDERLAACVNVHGPMTSTYRWKGNVEYDHERQLIIKTTVARLRELELRLRALHPYELPEFIVLKPESASAAYSSWVVEETHRG